MKLLLFALPQDLVVILAATGLVILLTALIWLLDRERGLQTAAAVEVATRPPTFLCACCGRGCWQPFCADCAGHVLAQGPIWERTWRAQYGEPCPNTKPSLYQRDEGDEHKDIVAEGVGVWPLVQEITPFARLGAHSPITPLAYLPEAEWQLWTSVIQESAR